MWASLLGSCMINCVGGKGLVWVICKSNVAKKTTKHHADSAEQISLLPSSVAVSLYVVSAFRIWFQTPYNSVFVQKL